MIVTKNDIEILENGEWYFRGERIDNPNVLNYFKANLSRDEGGYFILNRFGERLEKGYLKSVQGFALFVVRILLVARQELESLDLSEFQNKEEFLEHFTREEYLLCLELDAGPKYLLPLSRLCIFDESTLAVRLNEEKEAPLYARLSASAMASLWEYLSEDKKGYVLKVHSAQAGEEKFFPIARASLEEVFEERGNL